MEFRQMTSTEWAKNIWHNWYMKRTSGFGCGTLLCQILPMFGGGDMCFKIVCFRCHPDDIPKPSATFANLKFPVLTAHQIQNLFFEVQSNMHYVKALHKLEFPIIIPFDKLREILELLRLRKNITFCTCCLLHMGLAALVYPDELKSNANSAVFILNGLLEVLKSGECDCESVVVSAFYHFFRGFVSVKEITDRKGLLVLLFEFLGMKLTFEESVIDDLLCDTIENVLVCNGLDDIGELLLSEIENMVSQSAALSSRICSALKDHMQVQILTLNPRILLFFKKCHSVFSASQMGDIMKTLPLGIVAKIENSDVRIKQPDLAATFVINEARSSSNEANASSVERRSLMGKAPKSFGNVCLLPMKSLNEMIDPDLLKTVNSVIELVGTDSKYISLFLSDILKLMNWNESEERVFDVIVVVAYLIAFLIRKRGDTYLNAIFESVMNSILFDPRVNFMNETTDIISIKAQLLRLFLDESPELIVEVFKMLHEKPLVIGEVMYLLPGIGDNKRCVQMILKLLFEDFYAPVKNNGSVDELAMNYYRFSILAYLERMAENEKVRLLMVNEKCFVKGMGQMLLCDDYRDFAACLLSKCADPSGSWNRLVRETMHDVLRSSRRQNGNFDAFTEVLNILVGLGCFNMERHLKYILKKIQKLESPHPLLFSVIDILAKKRVTSYVVEIVSSVLKRLYHNNPPMTFFGKFVRMLAGPSQAHAKPTFVIVNPTALLLICATYCDSDAYCDVLNFLYELCLFSVKNRIEFNFLGLDLLFLRQFNVERNKQRALSLLRLYGLISSFVSSFVSVAQFFTTLYPGDGQIHPFAHEMLDELVEMVNLSASLPQAYIIINKDAVAKCVGLSTSWFNKGFTLNFWVFLERGVTKAILFELSDHSENLIQLSLDQDKFRLLVENSALSYSGVNPSPLNKNEWINVSVIFEPSSDSWRATFLYNGVPSGSLAVGALQFNNLVKFRVGNKTNQQEGVLLGSFSLLPVLTVIEADLIYYRGIRCEIADMNPYFQFIPMMKGKSLALDCKQNVTIDYNIVQLERQTFPDILALRSGVKRLLPVLYRVCESGQSTSVFLDKWILAFSQCVTVNNKAQLYFCEHAGFQAISLALSTTPGQLQCSITFYDMLLDLLDRMVSEKLRLELVKFLLLNLRIWLRCDFATASHALHQMANVVVPSAPQLSRTVLPFRTIVAIQRSLLYFEPIEESLVDHSRTSFTDSEIETLRRQLWHIGARIGEFELEIDDIHAFIIHLMTAGEKRQMLDMLLFSDTLFSNRKTDLLHANIGILVVIFYVIAGYDEEIVISLLTFLCTFHQKSKSVDATFDEDLDMIINELPDGLATPVLFDKVMNCCKNGHPELFPVLAWIARILKGTFVERMFTELTPNTLYCVTDHFTVYPFACLFGCSDDALGNGLRFLLKSAHTWKHFIAICTLVANVLGESSVRVQKRMIEEALKLLSQESNHLEDFYEIAFFYLLMQSSLEKGANQTFPRKTPCNEETKETSKTNYSSGFTRDILSCFSRDARNDRRETLRVSVSNRLSNQSFKWDMSVRFIVSFPVRYGYYFSLRSDENGLWSDIDLARSLVSLFEERPIPRFEKQAAFLRMCLELGPVQSQWTSNPSWNELAASLNETVSLDTESDFLRDLFTFQRKNYSRSAAMRSYCKDRLVSEVSKFTKEYTRYVEAMTLEENNTRHNFVVASSQRSWEEETNSQTYELDGTLCGDASVPVKLRPMVKTTNDEMETEGERCQIVNGLETIDATFRTIRGKVVIAGMGMCWRFGVNMIDHICFRTRYYENKSIEIVLKDRESIVLCFLDDAETVLRKFPNLSCKCNSDLKHFKELWRHRKISNFEYLVRVNFEAGRSFKDIDQYPIMPKVLARLDNYDLKDPSMFRDLTKPVKPKSGSVVSRAPLTRREVSLLLGRVLPFAHGFPPEKSELPASFSDVYTVFNEMEMIPEFYSNFEVMKEANGFKAMTFPDFATSTYELIYKHRKALESEFVSNSLNHWIDMIFGVKQRDGKSESQCHPPDSSDSTCQTKDVIESIRTHGQLSPVIFTNPHPKRKKKDSKKNIPTISTTLNHPHKLKAAAIISTENSKVKITAIDTTGKKFTSKIDMKAIKPTFNTRKSFGPFDIKSAIEIIPYQNGSFLMLERESTEILEIAENVTQYVGVTSYVSHVSFDGRVTAFSDDAGAFTILVSKSVTFTTRSFGGQIICTAVSESYECAVACTEENHMMICSVNHCELVRIVKLPGRPRRVVITPGWGFIVVAMEPTQKGGDEIATYTINGDLLARATIDGSTACLTSFVTPSGFDYIAIGSTNQHVFLAEAFYLRFQAVKSCESSVVALAYRSPGDSLIVVSADGAVAFVPAKIDE